VVLTPTATGISHVVEFHHSPLVEMFDFPDMLEDRSRPGV